MQEFNIDAFSDFIKTTLFETMTVEDYILVIEELFGIRPTKRSSSFITYHSFCHHEDERKGGENLSLKIETMMFTCYSHCGSFDLLELLVKRYELIGESKSRYKCMQLICSTCGIPFEFSNEEERVIEYDWKRELLKYRKGKKSVDKSEIKVYDDNILNYFPKVYHSDWISDNISIEVMQEYEICMYPYRNAILIPCRNIKNELIGIRMRLLDPKAEHKYFPLYMVDGTNYKFSTNESFYGIHKAKDAIKKHKRAVLVESEKGHLQGATYYGVDDNVIIGNYGRGFSDKKRNMLLELGITELSVAYDFDYSKVGEYNSEGEWIKTEEFLKFEESIMRTAEYFHGYCKVTALVSYSGHKLKDCATDNGKEWYEELYRNRETIFE